MADPEAPALQLQAIFKAYGAVQALDGLDFAVAAQRFFVLFGPSSVGKTTTLRTIAGLVAPDSGRLLINGADFTTVPIKGRSVSMVFQSFALYPHLTVFENMAYPLREAGERSAEIRKRVQETAEMLKLSHRLERKPGTLSGGEQQRVALGRSLIRRPKILLLDEPLTNLDAKLRHDMRAELKRLHRKFGMTIVYATPDELEALSMGEEIAVMRDGRVVQRGTPDELYEAPADLYVAAKIGSPHMNLIDALATSDGTGVTTPFGSFGLPEAARVSPGEALVMGIRPADLGLAGGIGAKLEPTVRLLEPLGDVTVVSLSEAGQTLRILLPEAKASGVRPGDRLPITVDPGKIHLFRRDNGAAVRA